MAERADTSEAIRPVEIVAAGLLMTADGRHVYAASEYTSGSMTTDGRPIRAVSTAAGVAAEGGIIKPLDLVTAGTLMTADGRPVEAVQFFDASGAAAPYSAGPPTTPGAEMNPDPGFDNPAAYTLNDASITISGSALNLTATPANKATACNPVITLTAGNWYRVSFTITSYTSGNIAVLGAGLVATFVSAVGTYSYDFLSTGGSPFLRGNQANTTLSVDNWSIKPLT